MRRALLSVVLPVVFGYAFGFGCVALTAEDKARIAKDALSIAICQGVARDCKEREGDAASKCWAAYDACLASKGLRDGGSE